MGYGEGGVSGDKTNTGHEGERRGLMADDFQPVGSIDINNLELSQHYLRVNLCHLDKKEEPRGLPSFKNLT